MNSRAIINKLKDKRFQRSAVIFVLCLLLSSVLWVFIHLSKTYSYPVTYALTYSSIPKGKAFADQPPTSITVMMSDMGFNVLSNQLTNTTEAVNIDLSGLKLKRKGSYYTSFMTSDAIIKRLSIDGNMNITAVIPDTMFFIFSYMETKRVPVKANISYKIANESDMYGEIKLSPDTVVLTATKNILDEINQIETKNSDFDVCASSITASLSLVNPHPDYITMSSSEVNVTLPIFKITEGEVTITISDTTTNGSIIKALPSTVKITYTVPLEYYNSINSDMFDVRLDNNLSTSNGMGMTISVVKCPDFVKIRKIYPPTAEYILLK